uniref:Glutamyl-tRNA(Gln) amidotransferase subunit A, mitochondrial n=1 Tax=Trichuris muris TaxID=70415 RepID=A0A5S6Q5K8_TRIMR
MFVTTKFEEALSKAELLDKIVTAKGPLFGVPFAVKDCFSTKAIRTTLCSVMLSNYKPSYNATLVNRLLNAGGILLGKTNMDEFSMGASSTKSLFGPVKNPWTLATDLVTKMDHDWYIAGGSSGGSAAAVACGVVKIALGSDTGGSTRNPAALCGVVGFKPTYGLLSRCGLVPLVNSFDTPGILARKVEDICLALRIISGWDCLDSTSIHSSRVEFTLDDSLLTRNLCVGIPREFYPPGLADDVLKCWKTVAKILERDAGCRLVDVSLPHTQFSIVCYHVLGESEIASNMARYDGIEYGFRAANETSFYSLLAAGRQKGFNETVKRRILAGNFFLLKRNYKHFYEKAACIRRLITEEYQSVFNAGVDVLLLPATQADAPLFSQYVAEDNEYTRERQDDFFTQPANLSGLPAIVIPVGLSNRKLPIGLQLVGNRFQDSLLLKIAKWLQDRVEFKFLPKKLLIDNV